MVEEAQGAERSMLYGVTALGVLLQRRNVHTHVIPRTLLRALAVRQAGPFAGVPDPLTLVSPPPF